MPAGTDFCLPPHLRFLGTTCTGLGAWVPGYYGGTICHIRFLLLLHRFSACLRFCRLQILEYHGLPHRLGCSYRMGVSLRSGFVSMGHYRNSRYMEHTGLWSDFSTRSGIFWRWRILCWEFSAQMPFSVSVGSWVPYRLGALCLIYLLATPGPYLDISCWFHYIANYVGFLLYMGA